MCAYGVGCVTIPNGTICDNDARELEELEDRNGVVRRFEPM